MTSKSKNPIREALDKAEELHAVWLGKQMEANEAKAKAQEDRKTLEDQHRAALQAIDKEVAEKDAAAESAKDALEAHQAESFEELGIGIDLTKAGGSGGRTRL